MTPKISVIIPVYNTKQYLKEAIDSILKEKEYLCDITIINDGSTDGSSDLLEKLYGNLNFIKIIHTKNNGQGHARNLGIDNSRATIFTVSIQMMLYFQDYLENFMN